jgi:hypothetical protein
MSVRRNHLLTHFCRARNSAGPRDAFLVAVSCPRGHMFQAKENRTYYCKVCGAVYEDDDMRRPKLGTRAVVKKKKSTRKESSKHHKK